MGEVSYEVPTTLPEPGQIHIAASRLVALPEVSEREEVVQTLFKLIDGVLVAPQELKKRRIRKSNEVFHRKVGRHEAALDLLRAVGFVDDDDPELEGDAGRGQLLIMPVAYLSRLMDAHHTLVAVAHEAGLPAPPLPATGGGSFNPFQSSFQATDTTRRTVAPDAWKTEADRMRDEVRKKELLNKEKVEQAPPVPLNPTAFWLASGRKLEDVIREATNPSEDKAADSALLQDQVASAKNGISGTAGKFQSADKRRLDDLTKKRVHECCVLRIICPDKSVLQVTFRAGDNGSHVLEQLENLLAPHVRTTRWYIYQSPPMKKLAPRETLSAAGLTPGANMYLGFEDGKPAPPFLEAGLVSQLGPPPEVNRGVTSAGGFEVGTTFSGEAMGWGSGKKVGGAPAAGGAATAAERPAAAAGTTATADSEGNQGAVPMQEG